MSLLRFLKKIASAGGHDCAGEGGVFISAPITGNGAPQSTPHGFGAVPSVAVAFVVGSPPVVYVGCTITPGAHDATNCIFTVQTNWVYQILAIQ